MIDGMFETGHHCSDTLLHAQTCELLSMPYYALHYYR
jgi:hypothetical protein